jgi:hypothetical protein
MTLLDVVLAGVYGAIDGGQTQVAIGAAERGEALPEAGLVVAPAAAERESRVGRAEVGASWQLAQRSSRHAGPVDRLPDACERTSEPQCLHGRREDQPASLLHDAVVAARRWKAA